MPSRIRIKLGQVEVEYEGDEAFLKAELPALLETVSKLIIANELLQGDRVAEKEQPSPEELAASGDGKIQMTTRAIAGKLRSHTGPDLIIAASLHLTLARGLDTFNRKEILDEMKTATGYYKNVFNNNLSRYLNQLVRNGQLRESSKGTYALNPQVKEEKEIQLAR